MVYHPTNNPTDLPPVTTVEDLDKLPWGGNHFWDHPIMNHIDKFVLDESHPHELRKAVCARACHLMMGAPDTMNDAEFDEYVREAQSYEKFLTTRRTTPNTLKCALRDNPGNRKTRRANKSKRRE